MATDCRSSRTPSLTDRLKIREAPAAAAPLIYQEWRKLLFLHWAMDPGALREHLPGGLSVDTCDGRAWIGIVPFYMRGIRPRFLPAVPGISNFLELNVRTYVCDDDGTPGVWFFSLDANSRLACALGRSLFKLAYRDARMDASEKDEWVHYSNRRCGRDSTADFHYRGIGEARVAEPGSLDFFLLERYLLFSHCEKTGRLFRGRVHHPPYRFQEAEVRSFSTLPSEWNGLSIPATPPEHAAFVESVKVRIFGVEKMSGAEK